MDMLTKVLLGVLAASALASALYFVFAVKRTRELRSLQGQLQMINGNGQYFNALFNEVYEYSKKNPSIDAALQSNPVWKNKGPATGKPAAK